MWHVWQRREMGGETRKNLEGPDILLKWIFKKCNWGGGKWICLAEHRDKRRAVVNTAMNLPVPLKAGNFLSSQGTISC
jgi:hypothetical protein